MRFQPPGSKGVSIPFSGEVIAYIKSLVQPFSGAGSGGAGGVSSVSFTPPLENTGSASAVVGAVTPSATNGYFLDTAGGVVGWSPVYIATGTSFPGSPPTGQIFYRSDLGTLYLYTGTAWLPFSNAALSAFPLNIIQEQQFNSGSSNVTSYTVTFPQTAASSGNTLFMLVGCDGSQAVTFPTGWTVAFNQAAPSFARIALLSIASASQTSATFTITTASSFAGYFFEVTGTHALDQSSTGASGNTQFLTLPSITPTAGAAVFGCAAFAVSSTTGSGAFPATTLSPKWRPIGVNAASGIDGRALIGQVFTGTSTGVAITPQQLDLDTLIFTGSGMAYASFSIL